MSDRRKYNFLELMMRWESSLDAYGTPRDFPDSTTVRLLYNKENSEDVPVRIIVSPNFSKRRELMKREKDIIEERKAKGLEQRWTNDGSSCFLCSNAGQAKDIGNNLMLPWETYEDYTLIPNRYPMVRGHFLLCAKEHNLKGESGITESYLEKTVELSERYNLYAVRNHRDSGMSIPEHEHLHLLFSKFHMSEIGKDIYLNGLVEHKLKQTEYGEGISLVHGREFATIAFSGNMAVERAYKLMKNLERDKIIFTSCYQSSLNGNEGTFFIGAHKRPDMHPEVKGAANLIYNIVLDSEREVSYNEYKKILEEHLYKKEEFLWGKYLCQDT